MSNLRIPGAALVLVLAFGALSTQPAHASDQPVVGRNASTTKPAKFVVVLLKKEGADVLMPVE